MALITAKGTARDKQDKSFVNSPCRENFTAQEVVVSNTSNNPIPVDPTTRGTPKFLFNEIVSNGIEEIEIINLTIPVGKNADLNNVICSGENIASYTVLKNDEVIAKKRTWYVNFDTIIPLVEIPVIEGDNIKILINNRTNESALFNVTLNYNEFDVWI